MQKLITAVILLCMSFTLAHADWRQDIGTLRIGIVAGDNVSHTIVQAEPFRLAVQEALNVPVEIFGARDFPALIRAHSDGRVEYAVLSATAYAAVHVICKCVEPSVVARASDGTTSYKSVIITRNKDNIKSIAQLKDKHLIALSANSIAGYSFALFELAKAGNNLLQQGAEISFGSKYEPAAKQFFEGKGDALIGWSSFTGEQSKGYSRGTLRDLAKIEGASLSDYRVIWQSSDISHSVHSIRKNLPGEAKTIVRELLSKMYKEDPAAYDSIEPYYSGGFSIARQSLLVPLIKFAKEPLFGTALKEVNTNTDQ